MPFLTPNTPPPGIEVVCRLVRLPASADFLSLFNGALASLLYEKNFEQHGSMSPEETAQFFKRMFLEIETDYCMIGEFRPFISSAIPNAWLLCDGSTHLTSDYPKLYDHLPAHMQLGETFTVPDLRRRGLVGWTDEPGFDEYSPGEAIGASEATLTEANNAAHTHTTDPHSHTDLGHSHIRLNSPGVTILAVAPGEAPVLTPSLVPGSTQPGFANLTEATVFVNPSGEGEPFDIRNRDLVVYWAIRAR